MSVVDLLTLVDSICKKYDKYDVAAKDSNVAGDDAFARLYASIESDIESALQKAETASNEKNRASVVAINAEIRRTKTKLLEEHIVDLKTLQRTFERYTERTAFGRPLTSGFAYAVRVLHSEREEFEKLQGWTIKRMDKVVQTPVLEDEYDLADLEPSHVQEEYVPVIFAQDTVAHVISVDMLSGEEDRENVLRARESGKGVLTAPFRLLKTNCLGVILTFAVYKKDLPPSVTSTERIQAIDGYLGGIFDIESLVEKLLHQLAMVLTLEIHLESMRCIAESLLELDRHALRPYGLWHIVFWQKLYTMSG